MRKHIQKPAKISGEQQRPGPAERWKNKSIFPKEQPLQNYGPRYRGTPNYFKYNALIDLPRKEFKSALLEAERTGKIREQIVADLYAWAAYSSNSTLRRWPTKKEILEMFPRAKIKGRAYPEKKEMQELAKLMEGKKIYETPKEAERAEEYIRHWLEQGRKKPIGEKGIYDIAHNPRIEIPRKEQPTKPATPHLNLATLKERLGNREWNYFAGWTSGIIGSRYRSALQAMEQNRTINAEQKREMMDWGKAFNKEKKRAPTKEEFLKRFPQYKGTEVDRRMKLWANEEALRAALQLVLDYKNENGIVPDIRKLNQFTESGPYGKNPPGKY